MGIILSVLAVLVVSMIPVCRIRKDEKVVAKTDKDNYNFAFNIDVISSNKQDRIEFVSAYGKNTKDLDITFVSDEEYCKTKEGKKKRTILCKCETKNNYTRIESLKLKINGREQDVRLKVPIENRTRSNIIFLKK